MHIFVNCLGQTKYVNFEKEDSFDQLLTNIQSQFGIDEELVLFSKTSKIENLDEISQGISVDALLDLQGGKGKKKRKNYTTPKKNKHVHKNVKLRALSYYAFNEDGSVKKIKKTCPQKTCAGQGIVMAHHKNRYYCGKCGFTLMIVKEQKK